MKNKIQILKKFVCAAGIALMVGSATTASADLVNYGFATDLTATTVDPGVTATEVSSVGLMFITNGNAFTNEANGLANGQNPNIQNAFDVGQFYAFTVTANSGNIINLENLTFDISRGLNGAADYAVRSSIDSFASDIFSGSITETSTLQTIDLAGAAFDELSSIEFRIAIDNRVTNTASNSGVALDDLQLNGVVVSAAVPEPSSLALLGLGGMFLASRRRRA